MSEPFRPGTKFGKYELVRLLGRGGMADVYEAHDPFLLRRVALKILPPEFSRDEERASRFIREVRSAAALTHPGIVTIYEVDQHEGCHYFTMNLLTGGDLKQKIKSGAIDPDAALELTGKIASALEHAHKRGLVHRDIKPENIVFSETGEPVVADFGIAKASSSGTHMTALGMLIGTPRYMSPEQAKGEQELDGRSDFYSLGIVAYEMLTGTVPFDAQTTMGILLKHIQDPVPKLDASLSRLQPFLDRMLAKDRDQRFANAQEICDAIARLKVNRPLPERTLSRNEAKAEAQSVLEALKQRRAGDTGTRKAVEPMAPAAPTTAIEAESPAAALPAAQPQPSAPAPLAPRSTRVAAQPTAARGNPPWLWIGLGAAALLVVGVVVAMFVGSGSKPATVTPTAQQPAPAIVPPVTTAPPVAVEPAQAATPVDSGATTVTGDPASGPTTSEPSATEPAASATVEPAPVTEPVIEISPEELRVAELMVAARRQLRASQISLPAGDNAVETLTELAALAPDNAEYRLLRRQVGDGLLTASRERLQAQDFAAAEALIRQIERFDPTRPDLSASREAIADVRAQVRSQPEPAPARVEPAPAPRRTEPAPPAIEPARPAAEARPTTPLDPPVSTPTAEVPVAEPIQAPVEVPVEAPVEAAVEPPAAAEPVAEVPPAPVPEPKVQVLRRTEPVYPRQAMRERLEGEVRLRVRLDAAGNVADVAVIDAKPRDVFNTAAINAVSNWKFNAGGDGRIATVTVEFKLQ